MSAVDITTLAIVGVILVILIVIVALAIVARNRIMRMFRGIDIGAPLQGNPVSVGGGSRVVTFQ